MKIDRLILVVLIIFSGVSIYLNYLNYRSYSIQAVFLDDIRNSNFGNKDYQFISDIHYDFPSLNQTAIPIKAITGQYYLGIDSIDIGLDLIYKGIKDNPFLNYSEAVLADYYYLTRNLDSFSKYSRKIMKEIPNSPVHFVLFSRLLLMDDKIDSVLITFENVIKNQKIKDFQNWKIFLASMKENYVYTDSTRVKELAETAKKKFKDNDEIRLLSDYILYSEENVQEAIRLNDDGIWTYNSGKKELGIELLEKAIFLHPSNKLAQKNLIKAYFFNEQWDEVVATYLEYSEYLERVDFETVFFYASSLMNTNKRQAACGVFQYLVKNNYAIPQGIKNECSIQ